ncbi:MAG: nicotinate-nucleotide adenylyltransferase [Methylovulum sp.]|jgi:nicotinate-nucleotide adenylyltransferase|nr:nicotinate-nucleotide adenylyltransferase [Methylovulum sp.]
MIGILGGTFNPIHFGHLRVAIEVKESFHLAELRLLPCACPPHREQPSVSAHQRAAMVKLAIAKHPGLFCDERELQRPGPSYMVDSLQSLKQEVADETLLLFIGTDAFSQLTSWSRWQQLFTYAHVVVMVRPENPLPLMQPFFLERLAQDANDLTLSPHGKLHIHSVTQLAISATTIRTLFAEQHNPSFLLPDAVIEYIQQHQLYHHTVR